MLMDMSLPVFGCAVGMAVQAADKAGSVCYGCSDAPQQYPSILLKCAGALVFNSSDQTTMNSPFFPYPPFFSAHPMATAMTMFPPNALIPSFFPPPFAFPSYYYPYPASSTSFAIGSDSLDAVHPENAQPSLLIGEAEANHQGDTLPDWALIPPPEFSASVNPAPPKREQQRGVAHACQKPKDESPARSLSDTAASELHRLLIERGLGPEMTHMRKGRKQATFVLPNELPCGNGVILVQRALDSELADKSTPLHEATYEKLKESLGQSIGGQVDEHLRMWATVKFFRNRGRVWAKATVGWEH